MSELIRQNKPVYAIDTADTETHFKRCFNLQCDYYLVPDVYAGKFQMYGWIYNWLLFAKDCTGWKYPCLHGTGYV